MLHKLPTNAYLWGNVSNIVDTHFIWQLSSRNSSLPHIRNINSQPDESQLLAIEHLNFQHWLFSLELLGSCFSHLSHIPSNYVWTNKKVLLYLNDFIDSFKSSPLCLGNFMGKIVWLVSLSVLCLVLYPNSLDYWSGIIWRW